MSTLPRRRWTYSLHSVFVVMTIAALFTAWLRSEWNLVHARRSFPLTEGMGNFTMHAQIPIWRRWLGDEAISVWGFPNHAPAETLARAQELFPEAMIVRLAPGQSVLALLPSLDSSPHSDDISALGTMQP